MYEIKKHISASVAVELNSKFTCTVLDGVEPISTPKKKIKKERSKNAKQKTCKKKERSSSDMLARKKTNSTNRTLSSQGSSTFIFCKVFFILLNSL